MRVLHIFKSLFVRSDSLTDIKTYKYLFDYSKKVSISVCISSIFVCILYIYTYCANHSCFESYRLDSFNWFSMLPTTDILNAKYTVTKRNEGINFTLQKRVQDYCDVCYGHCLFPTLKWTFSNSPEDHHDPLVGQESVCFKRQQNANFCKRFWLENWLNYKLSFHFACFDPCVPH